MKAVLVLRNAMAIAVAGTLFGLLANAISPRGLSLTRDYFTALVPTDPLRSASGSATRTVGGRLSPRDQMKAANDAAGAATSAQNESAQVRTARGEGTPPTPAQSATPQGTPPAPAESGTPQGNSPTSAESATTQGTQPTAAASSTPQRAGTTKRGLPLASHEAVVGWFHDPAYQEQRIIFIDARNDEAYAAGHIPGAYPFDHYHPERYLANVLAVSQLAERIVVYCTGGECEDSELATLDLIALGIPRAKLVIYGGGFTEWSERHLPIQTGKPKIP